MAGEAEWSDEFALLQEDFAAVRARYAAAWSRIARIQQENWHGAAGYSKLDGLLVDLLRVSAKEAKQLAAHATACSPTVTLTGYQQPPELAATAEAACAGSIGAEHIQVILTAMAAIPDTVPDEVKVSVEAELAGYAATMPPQTLTTAARHLLDHLDPDGAMPTEKELAEPQNAFHCQRTRTGRMRFRGEIDTESAEELESLLAGMALPTGTADLRSFPERMGDAFTELVHVAASAADLPGKPTTVPTVIVTIDHEALTKSTGAALLDGGTQVPASAARRIACDAELIPTVLGARSVVLDQGRKRRLVTREQRIALITRDRGCAFPHCDRPPRFCDAHHVTHWADGGPTDLNNLVLLCRRHHRVLHHSAWRLRMVNGSPEFTAPDWVNTRPLARRVRVAARPGSSVGVG